MNVQTFAMPDVGEGLTEAEILSWHVAVGDEVAVNQIFVEIETAKAAVELPSPFAGRVQALLVQPGVTVAVGTPIIAVDTAPAAGDDVDTSDGGPADRAAGSVNGGTGGHDPGADGPGADGPGAKIGETAADGRIATLVGYVSPGAGVTRRPRKGAASSVPPSAGSAVGLPPVAPDEAAAPSADPPAVLASAPAASASAAQSAQSAPKAAPPIRHLAKELGVELATIVPARPDGVITREEVEQAAHRQTAGAAEPAGPMSRGSRGERRVPVKGVRKLTAQAMVASAFSAPHVTEFLTVDVTALMQLRERLGKRAEFGGLKVTPLAFAARAVCLAARRTPEVNSVWDGAAGEIVVKDYVNLGIAAATPRGLVVPVIRDADLLTLPELAAAIGELADVARAGHTPPTAMTHGTFTITNVGVFGVDTGTPIINPGESAILALGSIKDAPWVVDGQLAVRKVCQLALSFDHRVIDGQQGSKFLADVGGLLADPGLSFAF